ncbi:universal stress protein [Hathewaya histolytica]|uniref:Osmosensitive K+ channel His kinase sensor n=1 Tax=Hathewaya histolytica TaxID=1498 RepID=A0A4U9R3G5_HATHI|nr:universal stress protein [Hathewaya histolytica]VTQ84553.1 osmosensitive K+ channel His kinase sensor [Hathewaya histolytica]
MNSSENRLSPEEALEIVERETLQEKRGSLKIYIGYAPGVGKTFSMLNEGNRYLKDNKDVVIGYVETHGRYDTLNQIGDLAVIPRKKLSYNNKILEDMDVEAIIKRNPSIVLIDELAHTNVPNCERKKRYEDVLYILSKGIDVITTLNIQHLESLNDLVKQITGVTVNETIPDYIVEDADEVVVVDLTPDALQDRLKKGKIYKKENIKRALGNFFRRGNLNALREVTLRHTAEGVDEELEEYMKEHGIKENWYTVERVLVCISSSPFAKKLIRRGYRISKKYKCEWIVAHVECTSIFEKKHLKENSQIIESHFKLAKDLGAEIVNLKGKSVSRELVSYASKHHVTQIIVSHSTRSFIQTMLRGSTINKILKHSKDIEVHVIPNNTMK